MLGFIGAGNMAGAIINGILGSDVQPAGRMMVYDINADKRAFFQTKGLLAASSAGELVHACDMIFLAVKPQNFAEVLQEARETVRPEKLFITIAAGISTRYITDMLRCGCPVVRAMPNTPLLIGKGATALCRSGNVTDEAFALVQSFFAACGTVTTLKEDEMNAVISVNGSSPAYIYLFAKAVVDSAVRQGIEADTALKLFCQTLVGSAGMLLESGSTPEQLIKMVSSPGGTTLKALEVLYGNEFEKTIDQAMLACTRRAEELGK